MLILALRRDRENARRSFQWTTSEPCKRSCLRQCRPLNGFRTVVLPDVGHVSFAMKSILTAIRSRQSDSKKIAAVQWNVKQAGNRSIPKQCFTCVEFHSEAQFMRPRELDDLPAPGRKNGMTTIFVGNLSFQTTESEVRNLFERYGRVTSVRVATDRGTGSPRGFAFVNMPYGEDAEEAIARANGNSIAGRSITVNEARDRNESGPPVVGVGRRSALLDAL